MTTPPTTESKPKRKRTRVALPKCGKATREGAKNPKCGRPCGWGTDHPGTGPCKLHGGASLVTHGRYATMRDETMRELIASFENDPDALNVFPELAAARALFVNFIDRYQAHTAALIAWHESYQETVLPIGEERALAFSAVLDEYEITLREGGGAEPTETQLARLADARSYVKELAADRLIVATAKPRQVLDVADAYKLVAEITKIAERIWKRGEANAVSRKELQRITDAMGATVKRLVYDAFPLTPEGQEAALKLLAGVRREWLTIAV